MGGRIISPAVSMSNELSEQAEINPYLSETTMVVLLALLCALVSILGLISILPWNCIWRSSEEYRAARLANTGLKKNSIKALPTIVYRKMISEPIVAECPICLAEFMEGESLRMLPKCKHSFHMECVDKWLLSHCSCPTCRHCLLHSLQLSTKQLQSSNSGVCAGEQFHLQTSLEEEDDHIVTSGRVPNVASDVESAITVEPSELRSRSSELQLLRSVGFCEH